MCPEAQRDARSDILTVQDRDMACTCITNMFLYFKRFHALQAHRVANCLWNPGEHVSAQYLQSQASQYFLINVHTKDTLGYGIMVDHGTGIIIGETGSCLLGNIMVGDSCQVRAGTLVIGDLPPQSVAVGVPDRIIVLFIDVSEQTSIGMNQLMRNESDAEIIITFETEDI